jgi:hypothetical protein
VDTYFFRRIVELSNSPQIGDSNMKFDVDLSSNYCRHRCYDRSHMVFFVE